MSLFDSLLTDAEAAVIVRDPVISFGCMGCARTNELVNFLIRAKKIPLLEVDYPENEDNAKEFVYKISEFLKSLKPAEDKK
jgi:putative methanogenesis marker protein 5